jgi:hypothetical protein
MVREGKGFEDVNGRYKMPKGFATSAERLEKKAEEFTGKKGIKHVK